MNLRGWVFVDPALLTVRLAMRNRGPPGEIAMTGSDRVRLRNSTLLDLIATAFSVRAVQVSGPAWLSDQGVDTRTSSAVTRFVYPIVVFASTCPDHYLRRIACGTL
jgi:hypothetical protein